MNGKQHFAIGVSVTVSTMLIGLSTSNNALVLSSIVAPFGAMLPDIDHDKTDLGRIRYSVLSKIDKSILILSIVAIIVGFYNIYTRFNIFNNIVMIVGFLCVILITQTPLITSHLKFYTRHRGIMHTMVVPAVVMLLSFNADVAFIRSIAISFSLGYVSHLFADMHTFMGCPVAFPITKKYIHVPIIRVHSNTWQCNVVTVYIMLLIVGIGIYVQNGGFYDIFRIFEFVQFN